MQLVVEISEDTFFDLKRKQNRTEVDNAVLKGTPLPKGHGRLIDADNIALIDEQFYVPSDYYVAESAINDAPTIIEADKADKADY